MRIPLIGRSGRPPGPEPTKRTLAGERGLHGRGDRVVRTGRLTSSKEALIAESAPLFLSYVRLSPLGLRRNVAGGFCHPQLLMHPLSLALLGPLGGEFRVLLGFVFLWRTESSWRQGSPDPMPRYSTTCRDPAPMAAHRWSWNR